MTFIHNGGPVIWLILIAAAIALVVFVERALFCHSSQINSAAFLNGVRTVLKRDNVVDRLAHRDVFEFVSANPRLHPRGALIHDAA